MKFTTIDFETANPDRSSACSIGIAIVEDGKIIEQRQQLIRPDPLIFDPFHVSIHGITEEDVADAPTFAEYWPKLKSDLIGPVVAHNAAFDMSVLRYALNKSGNIYPNMDYFCTWVISRIAWPEYPTYSLDYLANNFGITFKHHDASEDARACALIALETCKHFSVQSLYDLPKKCGIRVGRLFRGGYDPCGGPRMCRDSTLKVQKTHANEIVPKSTSFDIDHPFCGKTFVFTGALDSMPRVQAMQTVVDLGGTCTDSVTSQTDYLVLGQRGYVGYRSGFKSSKMKKAEDLSRRKHAIEILSEADFIKMI